MSDKRVCAVVVTYNRKDLLRENLEALLAQTYDNLDILVVDNASTDSTKEYISDLIGKKITYYNTEKNIGGAGGFNFGIKQAIKKKKYEFIWIMDDDTIPQTNALKALMDDAYNINFRFSFLSSLVKWNDETLCNMNKQIIDSEWEKNYSHIDIGLVPIVKATFVSFFINAKVIEKVGLPIKDFFIYGDDWEYSIRLAKECVGYMDVNSIVFHKMKNNKTANIIDCDEERIERCFYDFRNTYYIYKKYFSNKVVNKFLLGCIANIIHILKQSKCKKIQRIKVMIKGISSGKKFNPVIEYTGED